MRFLLTNDDGVDAPGLHALAQALKPLGQTLIVAPTHEMSAQSHAITVSHPLRLRKRTESIYSVDGTPADCVMLSLQNLLSSPPEWVISGINGGGNVGTDTIYSGTVGAAMEAAMNNVPAIAVSLEGVSRKHNMDEELHYETAAKLCNHLVSQRSFAENLDPGQLYNLNVPDFPFEDVRGLRIAGLGRRHYEEKMSERLDPRGGQYFWNGGSGNRYAPIPGSDCVLLYEGYATLSVLQSSFYSENKTDKLRANEKKLADGFFHIQNNS